MATKATIHDLYRMCNSITACKDCVLHNYNIECSFLEHLSEKDIAEISEKVSEWCEKNPRKTYKEDFLSKFPNAKINSDGVPISCRNALYFNTTNCNGETNCKDCWNKPMEE